MKVRIVSYEDVNKWILGKFAKKMNETLLRLNIESDIGFTVDLKADINHHIIYYDYNAKPSTIDTLMITHIDSTGKLNMLKKQLEVAQIGICMSKETTINLIKMGLPAQKLVYVNPAHDGVIKPKRIVIGITSKVQPSGCKREKLLYYLIGKVDLTSFEFRIMGEGWNSIINELLNKGAEVKYFPSFDYNEYIKLIPSLDYYLYMGQDEGSMGYIDALAAGVKTIVTPQGYHLDALNGITFSFNTSEELIAVFRKLSDERKNLIDSVSSWTWEKYTEKHVDIWEYLISKKENKTYIFGKDYPDGINSFNTISTEDTKSSVSSNTKSSLKLLYGELKMRYVLSNKVKFIKSLPRKGLDYIMVRKKSNNR